MHPVRKPDNGSPIQLGEVERHTVGFDLGQERLLQRPERPLHLAFAFRVTGPTRRDPRPVMSSETDRRWVQLEPAALRPAQRTHPVGATQRRHATDLVEEPDHALKGVMAVLARGEPPHPPPRPRQDHPETDEVDGPADLPRPRAEVAEVELGLLARVGIDRHRHHIGCAEPRAPDVAYGPHDRRVAPLEPIRDETMMDAHRLQPRPLVNHCLDPFAPVIGHHRRCCLAPLDRWAVLQPVADRRAVPAGCASLKPSHMQKWTAGGRDSTGSDSPVIPDADQSGPIEPGK